MQLHQMLEKFLQVYSKMNFNEIVADDFCHEQITLYLKGIRGDKIHSMTTCFIEDMQQLTGLLNS